MAADDQFAPGDVELVDLPGGKKGLKSVRDGQVVVVPLSDTNYMEKAIAAHKAAANARANGSSESEEREYAETASRIYGLPKEAIL